MIHAGLSHLGPFFHALLSHSSYRWHFHALSCLKENVFVSVKLPIPVILRNRSDVAMFELSTSCERGLCVEGDVASKSAVCFSVVLMECHYACSSQGRVIDPSCSAAFT